LKRALPLHRIARSFGYEILRRKKQATLGSHLDALFQRMRINCVVDVGANRGQFAESLRAFGYQGRIVSVEPVVASYQQILERSSDDENWICYHLALGDFNGTERINVAKETALSSFLPPNEYVLRQFAPAVTAYVEEVEVRRLDDLFDEVIAGLDTPRVYLKLDTQGYDLRVVEGGLESLKAIGALQSEMSVLPISEGMPDYVTALRRFRQLGFEVTGIYSVTRDKNSLIMIEFDCVMRRPT